MTLFRSAFSNIFFIMVIFQFFREGTEDFSLFLSLSLLAFFMILRNQPEALHMPDRQGL